MHMSDGLVERTVKVIWIRHGETADNARHIIQVDHLYRNCRMELD